MRVVIIRVKSASVTIDDRMNGEIGQGLLVLLRVGPSDTEAQVAKLTDKVYGLRISEDENEKMNLNLEAMGGALLAMSRLTLYTDAKFRCPGFTRAAKSPVAIPLYEKFMAECAGRSFQVEHDEFGADMQAYLQDDGLVTILSNTDQMQGRTRPRAPGTPERSGGAKIPVPGQIHSAPVDKKEVGVPARRAPHGVFGTDMQVYSQNDGSATILPDTNQMQGRAYSRHLRTATGAASTNSAEYDIISGDIPPGRGGSCGRPQRHRQPLMRRKGMRIEVVQVGQPGTNCYSLEDEETRTVAVVDLGGERIHILAQLRADGVGLKLTLLTRAHFDYAGDVVEPCATLPRVPVYLRPVDAALVGGDVPPAVGAETTPYQDGDVVKLGRVDIGMLHTPGRTLGGVTLKMGDVPLTGDTLFQGFIDRADFEGGSYAEIMASLRQLGRLSGGYHVPPGHMGASTLKQEHKTNYYLRETIEG